MLNGTVEPLLTMNSTNNRLMSLMITNGDSNSNNNNNNNETLSKRSVTKASSLLDTMSSINSNNNHSHDELNKSIELLQSQIAKLLNFQFQYKSHIESQYRIERNYPCRMVRPHPAAVHIDTTTSQIGIFILNLLHC